ARERDYSKPDERTAREYQARVDEHISKRSEYNASRYGQGTKENVKTDFDKEHLITLIGRNNAISRASNRDNGLYDLQQQQSDRYTDKDKRSGTQAAGIRAIENKSKHSAMPDGNEQGSTLLVGEPEGKSNESENAKITKGESFSINQRNGAVNNDGARTQLIENNRISFRKIESGANEISKTFSSISEQAGFTRDRIREGNNRIEQQKYSENRASKSIEDVSNRLEQFTRHIELMLQNIAVIIRDKLAKKEKEKADNERKINKLKTDADKKKLEAKLDALADQYVKDFSVLKEDAVEAISYANIESISMLESRLNDPEAVETLNKAVMEIHKWNQQDRERDREYARSRDHGFDI
ncbi:hypothetical protein, partial [Escherichia coli]|uniref:hypothetical protein n=2 Tax=Pseudomonadota TaxID=1224 RepID=UPI003B7CFC35